MDSLGEGGVTLKQIKLKVLYTFDSEHKNNHLARWPQAIEVQAAPIDETSIIGIIQLRTCLEAIITASPELTSNLDNDYTIYAYDYSEPDTPLVGQGLLSKALAQDENEDLDNEAMVTGRITKNVMGLFSKNAQETLEVKLRLTPVAATYSRRRSGSISSNPDTVQQQWNSLSQTNGVFRPSSPMDTSGLETMQRMLSEGGPRSGNFQKESFYGRTSRPTSRAGTPTQAQQPTFTTRQSLPQNRPESRSGTYRLHARRDSFNSGYYSGEEAVDDGPMKKRAKIERVDRPSKSTFNIERQSDSLRVTASAASSVRLHRPVPQYPGVAMLQNGDVNDDPVRPPTPIPGEKPKRPRGRPKKVISPNLLRGPKARQSSPAKRSQELNESALSSPEEVRGDSVTSTPAPVDLPSSPPVMPEQQNYVTSPALPPLVNEADSGFMSGNLDDLFDDPALDFGDFLHEKIDVTDPSNFEIDPTLVLEDEHFMNLDEDNVTEQQPAPVMPPPVEKPDRAYQLSRTQSLGSNHRSIAPAPRLEPASMHIHDQPTDLTRAQKSLPPIPGSDPVARPFRRSNTWAPDSSDTIMSDTGLMIDDLGKQKVKKRVGKEQTKARLENAIASGEMPPFCDNCGAIETPAWRRAFTKVFDSSYDEFQTSLETGECCYKEPMERRPDGSVKLWKGYRTEKRPEEKSADVDGWTQICLCNPCGLWFHKSKYPRPPEKWQKKDPNEKRKRKRGPKTKKKTVRPIKSDAPTPASEDSSPADTSAEGENGEDYGYDTTANEDAAEDGEPRLPPMPASYRAGSAEPVPRGLSNLALKRSIGRRQIKSSPLRGAQVMFNAVDKTPQSVRRQLFPSPGSLQNKAKAMIEIKSDSDLPNFVRRSPRLNKTRDVFALQNQSFSMLLVDGDGKENIAPVMQSTVELDDLFDGAEDLMLPPSTPTPKRRSERLLSRTPGKTPTRGFGTTLDMNVQFHSPSMKTPKFKVHPVASVLANATQHSQDVAEMTPFTRSIHEALQGQLSLDLITTPQIKRSSRPGRTPRKTPPDNNELDFPDLPSLKGSSPLDGTNNFAINFSEMTTDQLNTDYNVFSTDAPMPSSPPPGFFNFLDIDSHDMEGIWDDPGLPQEKHSDQTTNSTGLMRAPENTSPLRRSPRKHAV